MRYEKCLLRAFVTATLAFSALSVNAGDVRTVLPTPHKSFECVACHGTAQPSNIPKNDTCLSCHGSMEKLIKATSKYALNPHQPPHWNDEIPCGTCHKQHVKPVVQCAACHTNQGYKAR